MTSSALTSAQSMYWTTRHLPGGAAAHIACNVVYVVGPHTAASLIAHVDATLASHDAYQARFPVISFRPAQVFDRAPPVAALIDLRGQPDRLEAAARLAATEYEKPFDLQRGLLFRAHVVALEDDLSLIVTANHHIISDLWSGRLFYEEICARITDRQPLAPEATFRQFVDGGSQMVAGEEHSCRLAYWRDELAGAGPAPFGALVKPDLQSYLFGWTPLAGERVDVVARERKTTPFVVLLSRFGQCLRRWTGQRDFVVGYMTANRRETRFARVVGSFAEQQIVRLRLPEDPAEDPLPSVAEAFKHSLAHAMPLAVLAGALGERTLSTVLLNVVRLPRSSLAEETAAPSATAVAAGAKITPGGLSLFEPHRARGLELVPMTMPMKTLGLDLSVTVSGGAVYGQYDANKMTVEDIDTHLRATL
jgi:hypothetical protein